MGVRLMFLFDKYYNQILWTAVVILAAMAVWMYISRSRAVTEGSAWTELTSARTPEEFTDIPAKYPSSTAAAWARLQAAESYLQGALKASFTNREESNASLKRAREQYQALVDASDTPALAREQAYMGLAKCIEASSSGDTEPAIKAYQELLAKFPDTVYKKHAEGRIADLKKSSTQAFYAWFHKQNPKPPEQPKPQDNQAPGAGMSIPSPGALGGLPAPPPPPTDEKPADKTGDKKPDDKPLDAKPAAEKAPEKAPAKTPEKPAAAPPKADAPKTDAKKPDAPKPAAK
ncbi:MAG: hypothetical protein U0903_14910 [Planctomycetales bacterium]